jgi:hypothetical protein
MANIVQVVALLSLGCLVGCAPTTPLRGEQSVVAEALSSRIMAGDIPDLGLLPDTGAIIVVQHPQLISSGHGLARQELTSVDGRAIVMATADSVQALARQTGADVFFISVGPMSRRRNKLRIGMGVDAASPEPATLGKLCCCSGDALFSLRRGRVTFSGWGIVVCA